MLKKEKGSTISGTPLASAGRAGDLLQDQPGHHRLIARWNRLVRLVNECGLNTTVRPTPGVHYADATGLLVRLRIKTLGHDDVPTELRFVPPLVGLHKQNPLEHLHLAL